jgi:hypothetical protein
MEAVRRARDNVVEMRERERDCGFVDDRGDEDDDDAEKREGRKSNCC